MDRNTADKITGFFSTVDMKSFEGTDLMVGYIERQ
ncbi:hypothetical protein LCGC14_1859770 [marine sediment metagenome]|uniref:Uncharacterized protein n=1 Tax=marine sediment metagenome TaxID=412755 RepID=A0A0F9GWA7_9ZZZZ